MSDHAAARVDFLTETLGLVEAGDLDACVARMAPDFRMHLAGLTEPMVGTEVWRGGTDYLRAAFSDLRVRVDDAFAADGDRVVVLATLSGVHRGEFLGVEATGRQVSWASHEVYRVVDGVITDEWICSDLHGLTGQLAG